MIGNSGGQRPFKLITVTEVYAMRSRKQDELAFYQKELEKLNAKMSIIHQEIELTTTIIKMIENEEVMDLREKLRKDRE